MLLRHLSFLCSGMYSLVQPAMAFIKSNDDLKIAKAIKYSLQNESTEAYYADSVQDALSLSRIYAGAW